MENRLISIGKYRGLQQCSTYFNTFSILTLDHRNMLRKALSPENPSIITIDEMSDFKKEVVKAVGKSCTAVLLDQEFGGPQCIISGDLPGPTGLLIALEATGYFGGPESRQSQILPGWSVAKAKRMGTNAVKLLVYYHPQAPSSKGTELLLEKVAAECIEEDIPLFLEAIPFSLDPSSEEVHPEERHSITIEMVRRLSIPGVDVMKIEFPVDIQTEKDERSWTTACREVTDNCRVPWVLLSTAIDFDLYIKQVTIACTQGASGAAVGRPIWLEAAGLKDMDRQIFLERVAYPRMERLTILCKALGRPWSDIYSCAPMDETWVQNY